MAFTQKDLEAQIALYEELKEEFSRLEAKEKLFMEEQGISAEDLRIDFNNLSPEEKRLVDYAKNEAKYVGESRTNNSNASQVKAGVLGRRGAIRL